MSILLIISVPVVVGCYHISKFMVYLGIATVRTVKAMRRDDEDED